MTPQSAAALRALETEIRKRAEEPIQDSIAYLAYNYCADRIAAVLTQEGAEGDRFAAVLAEARRVAPFGQGGESTGYIAGWTDVLEFIARAYEDKNYRLPAPTEPRGAGAAMNEHDYLVALIGQTAYDDMQRLEKERDAKLVAALKEPRPATSPAEPRTSKAAVFYIAPEAVDAALNGGGVEATVYSEPESENSVPLYTAAAAVPAGGDAVVWIEWNGQSEEAFRLAVLNYGYRCIYAARERTSQQREWETAAFERVIAEMRKLATPAPRGGVTDAFVHSIAGSLIEAGWISPAGKAGTVRAAIEGSLYLFTPSAAQVQDAVPMARHWIAALYHHSIPPSRAESIEQHARALAAKGAK